MESIVEPEIIFSPQEIKCLKRWISFYENPMGPALISIVGAFLGVTAFLIVLVQFDVELPRITREIWLGFLLFSCLIGAGVFIATTSLAKKVFHRFDEKYFRLTGMSEEQYLDSLVADVRRDACLRFTSMPTAQGITMLDSPHDREAQVVAYQAYESGFVRDCALAEERLQFKAYVARRFGLRVPLKK